MPRFKTIVVYRNGEGEVTNFGPFYGPDEAGAWIDEHAVEGIPGTWLIDSLVSPREDRRSEIVDEDEDGNPYEASDPKHGKYHSTHADIWDQREGK
jgi:hypothetical protein